MKKNIILNNIYNIYVAQWLESRNSNPKTRVSIPWWCSVTNSFSVPLIKSTLVQACLHGTHPNCVRILKIPCPSVISNIASALEEIHWQNNKNQHTAPADSFFDATGASI